MGKRSVSGMINVWCGSSSLATSLPHIYQLSGDKDVGVQSSYNMLENQVVWTPSLRSSIQE
uniref:Uncharacterized protein n=1 Tax=Nelumbo nucifera TaxID=4432 RepID=A0A822ZDD7_NELNU|nr:TPA_asm: hypothetical protein HUJ06_016024 [Nelumbo nucifera]